MAIPDIKSATSFALSSMIKVQGGTTVRIDGVTLQCSLQSDDRSLSPVMGGMLPGDGGTILVSKGDYPDRPEENCEIEFPNGELGADQPLLAASITDRKGYWLIVAENTLDQ